MNELEKRSDLLLFWTESIDDFQIENKFKNQKETFYFNAWIVRDDWKKRNFWDISVVPARKNTFQMEKFHENNSCRLKEKQIGIPWISFLRWSF